MPSLRLPRPGPSQFGGEQFEALGELADTYRKFDEISAAAESSQRARTISAEIDAAIQKTKEEFPNQPDVFDSYAKSRAQEVMEQGLKGASNDRVRELIQFKLADDLPRKQVQVSHEARQMKIGIAQGQWQLYEEELQRQLAQEQDPSVKARLQAEYDVELQRMTGVGVFTPKEAVNRRQKILENQAYLEATRAIRSTDDALKTTDDLLRRFPNIDPARLAGLEQRALAQAQRNEKVVEKALKDKRDQHVLDDSIAASTGLLSLGQLAENAKRYRYTDAEFRSLRSLIEQGGTTDPKVEIAYEALLRSGGAVRPSEITNNPHLDKTAKSKLLGLMQEGKDEKHFSKTPEYQEAVREFRTAVSRKGPLESLEPTEQKRLLLGQRELWDRASRGESPMAVSRELQARITPEEMAGDAPLYYPQYQTKEELVQALQQGRISRDQFNDQALLFEQWGQYNQRLEAAKQRKGQGQSGRRTR